MSKRLNHPSAQSDHRQITNSPHSVALQVGPNRLKVECLCGQKAGTILQSTSKVRDRYSLATATDDQGYEALFDGRMCATLFPWFPAGLVPLLQVRKGVFPCLAVSFSYVKDA